MFDFEKFATLQSKTVRLKKAPATLSALVTPTFFFEGTRFMLYERQMACRNELRRIGKNGGLDAVDLEVLKECLKVPCEIGADGTGLLNALLADADLEPVPSLGVFDYGKFHEQSGNMPSLGKMPALEQALRQPLFFMDPKPKVLDERIHACRAELARHAREHSGFTEAEVEILRSCMLTPCDVQSDGAAFLELMISCMQEN